LMNEISISTNEEYEKSDTDFMDIGRIKLNRKKQKEGIYALRSLNDNNNNGRNLQPISASACQFRIGEL